MRPDVSGLYPKMHNFDFKEPAHLPHPPPTSLYTVGKAQGLEDGGAVTQVRMEGGERRGCGSSCPAPFDGIMPLSVVPRNTGEV